MEAHGISFSKPKIDLDKLRGWKDGVVSKLTGGLNGLAKGRKVTVVKGVGLATVETAWGLYLFTGCILASLTISHLTRRT